MLESTNIFLWIQKQSFLTDRLSAFDRRRRRVAAANQRASVTLNNRVGIIRGASRILAGIALESFGCV